MSKQLASVTIARFGARNASIAARRIAHWAGVRHHEGRTSAMDCIVPDLRAAVAKKTREELDLENFRGKFTGVTGAGR